MHGEGTVCVATQRMSWEEEECEHCRVLVSVPGERRRLSQASLECLCSHLWALIEALGQAPP